MRFHAGNNKRIVYGDVPHEGFELRTSTVTTFYETLDYCFEMVLGDMLGSEVRDTVFGVIERNGIPRRDVSVRFDDAVAIMVKVLGNCSRVLVLRTIKEMCNQYSQRMEFSYQDSLRDQLMLLKESVLANHLVPRRIHDDASIDVSASPGLIS